MVETQNTYTPQVINHEQLSVYAGYPGEKEGAEELAKRLFGTPPQATKIGSAPAQHLLPAPEIGHLLPAENQRAEKAT